jgi:hypothetical protein
MPPNHKKGTKRAKLKNDWTRFNITIKRLVVSHKRSFLPKKINSFRVLVLRYYRKKITEVFIGNRCW